MAAASWPLDGEAAEGRLREDPLYAGAAYRTLVRAVLKPDGGHARGGE